MELTKDFILRGPDWVETINKLSPLFRVRTNYEIFMFCLAIGIMYDQSIKEMKDYPEEESSDDFEKMAKTYDREPKNVPRNVIQNNDNGRIDLMLQAAILTTKTLNLTEDERLELAFGEKKPNDTFDRQSFLLGFANFGVTVLKKYVKDTEYESMESIKNFLVSTMAGRNIDVDGTSEEEIMDILASEEEY